MQTPTRTFQLIEAKLGRPLAEYVQHMRAEGASWHAISLAIATETGVAVTPETIRIWLADTPGMQRGTKAAS